MIKLDQELASPQPSCVCRLKQLVGLFCFRPYTVEAMRRPQVVGVLLNCIVTDMTYNTAQPPVPNGRKTPVRWAAPPALRPLGALGEERWGVGVGFLEPIPPAEPQAMI